MTFLSELPRRVVVDIIGGQWCSLRDAAKLDSACNAKSRNLLLSIFSDPHTSFSSLTWYRVAFLHWIKLRSIKLRDVAIVISEYNYKVLNLSMVTSLDVTFNYYNGPPSEDFDLIGLVNSCPKLCSLTVFQYRYLNDDTVLHINSSILSQLTNITLIAEECTDITGKSIQHIAKHCSNLSNIKFEIPIPFTEIDDIIELIEVHKTSLEFIHLDFIGYELPEEFNDEDKHMIKLLTTITTHCFDLKELILESFECIKVSQLAPIIQNCPNLTKLYAKPSMEYMYFRYSTTETTVDGVKMIQIKDYQTDHMLTGGDELFLFFSKVRNLRVISLSGVHIITHDVIVAIAENNANTLVTLCFDECHKTFTVDSLKVLLSHCKVLASIDLKHVVSSAPLLKELFDTPNSITRITTGVCDVETIKHILEANPQMTGVTVQDCPYQAQLELKAMLRESGLSSRAKLEFSETDWHRFH